MFREAFSGLIDLIYPRICLVCKSKLQAAHIDNLVCKKCWCAIDMNAPPFCRSCGKQLEKKSFAGNICPKCVRKTLNFDRAFSPCRYDGVIKELIHSFKYAGKDYLGAPLSRLMVEFIREYNLPIEYMDYIIPLPLHSAKMREREFNQAEILSRHIAVEFNKDILKGNLIRRRFTRTQTELEPQERFLNVKGSFSLREPDKIKGKNLLLVDDVLTTGATASEAAGALKDNGANIVFVLTLAS